MKSCLEEQFWQISIVMLEEPEWFYEEFKEKFDELLEYKERVDKIKKNNGI